MASTRQRRPLGIVTDGSSFSTIDTGTMCRVQTDSPGSVGIAARISDLDLQTRFAIVLRRTGPKLPGELREEFEALVAPSRNYD